MTTLNYFSTIASQHTYFANRSGTMASYGRRSEDWKLQLDQAEREVKQLDKQIVAQEIRVGIAENDKDNHLRQIEQADEIFDVLSRKFTNEELYSWQRGQLSALHYQAYRMAYDLAKAAERAAQHELGLKPEEFHNIEFGHWGSRRDGLLAAERLRHDLARLDRAYMDRNQRELEITKHISLRQRNPLALLNLKATGSCEVVVPEWVFDLDNPGHYMRRLRNVSISIPSVTGPYTGVNCALSLVRSTVRHSPLLKDGEYRRDEGSDDDRFIDYVGTVQSIVTSSGDNDSGLFETNLRDERYLPFEGAGTESTWNLELPTAFRQFDYDTISDVILHFRYTARQGGPLLRDNAIERLEEIVENAAEAELALLFSAQHDFPSEWHRFTAGTSDFVATVKRDYFPYFTQGGTIAIDDIGAYTVNDDVEEVTTVEFDPVSATAGLRSAAGEFELSISLAGNESLRIGRVFIMIRYSLSPSI